MEELLKDFNDKLFAAQIARQKLLSFLEETTGREIDYSEFNYLEDDCDWCYGINTDKLKEILGE